MNNTFSTRLQLVFWNFTIMALSQSQVARSVLQRIANLAHRSEVTSLGILMGMCGVAGLISGYLYFFLTISAR